MNKIEEVDHLRLQLATCEVARLKAEHDRAVMALQAERSKLQAKYEFADGDGYNPQTLEIKRASKPEVLKAVEGK